MCPPPSDSDVAARQVARRRALHNILVLEAGVATVTTSGRVVNLRNKTHRKPPPVKKRRSG